MLIACTLEPFLYPSSELLSSRHVTTDSSAFMNSSYSGLSLFIKVYIEGAKRAYLNFISLCHTLFIRFLSELF